MVSFPVEDSLTYRNRCCPLAVSREFRAPGEICKQGARGGALGRSALKRVAASEDGGGGGAISDCGGSGGGIFFSFSVAATHPIFSRRCEMK